VLRLSCGTEPWPRLAEILTKGLGAVANERGTSP